MDTTTTKRTHYTCSCCGRGDWNTTTQDPDRDTGFDTCPACVAWIGERADAQLDKLADKLEAALNPTNAAKFAAMDTDSRRALASTAIEDGLVGWTIEASEPVNVLDQTLIPGLD